MNTSEIITTVFVILILLILFTYALMMIKFFTDDLRAALSFSETKRVESLVMPEHVDVVVRQSGRRPDGTVDRSDGNGVYMYRTPSGIYALRASDDIDRLCRYDSAWLNALIEHQLGSAARDLVADVYETADGHWNLAHIHNADLRGPDLRVSITKGQSLEKVGAREFRFVISPMPLDLKNRPDGSPSGGKRSDGGNKAE